MTEKLKELNPLACSMMKLFPKSYKIVTIPMLYDREVKEYVMRIEEGHNKAASSTLRFCG